VKGDGDCVGFGDHSLTGLHVLFQEFNKLISEIIILIPAAITAQGLTRDALIPTLSAEDAGVDLKGCQLISKAPVWGPQFFEFLSLFRQ
jgi:hypothetical protein